MCNIFENVGTRHWMFKRELLHQNSNLGARLTTYLRLNIALQVHPSNITDSLAWLRSHNHSANSTFREKTECWRLLSTSHHTLSRYYTYHQQFQHSKQTNLTLLSTNVPNKILQTLLVKQQDSRPVLYSLPLVAYKLPIDASDTSMMTKLRMTTCWSSMAAECHRTESSQSLSLVLTNTSG